MRRRSQTAWERSYLSVDWSQPVNWDHPLNNGLVAWFLATHQRSWTNTFRNLVHPGQHFTGNNTENTDWSSVIGAQRPGGWGCIDLGGTNEYFGAAVVPVTAYPLTMTAWFNPANATAAHTIFAMSNSGNGTDYASIVARGDLAGDPVTIEMGNPTTFDDDSRTTTGFTAGTWNHAAGVALTSATADFHSYLNGGSKGTGTGVAVTYPSLNRTDIGADLNSGGPYGPFLGQIDCVRIYSRGLTDDDVLEEYRLTSNYSIGLLNRRRRVTWFVPAGGVNENASPVVEASSVVTPGITLSQAGVAITMLGGVAVPTVLLNLAVSPLSLVGGVVAPALTLNQAPSPVVETETVPAAGTSGWVETPSPVVQTEAVGTQATTLNHAASAVAEASSVVSHSTTVSQAASALTEVETVAASSTTLANSQSPITEAETVASQTMTLSQAGSPVTQTEAVVSVATALNQAASPVTAAFSVPAASTAGDTTVAPDPVAEASAVASPATALDQAAGAVAEVSAVAAQAVTLSQASSPVTFAASVTGESESLSQAPSAVAEPSAVASPSTALSLAVSPASEAESVASATLVIAPQPSPIQVAASVAAPATAITVAPSPVTAVYSVTIVVTSADEIVTGPGGFSVGYVYCPGAAKAKVFVPLIVADGYVAGASQSKVL